MAASNYLWNRYIINWNHRVEDSDTEDSDSEYSNFESSMAGPEVVVIARSNTNADEDRARQLTAARKTKQAAEWASVSTKGDEEDERQKVQAALDHVAYVRARRDAKRALVRQRRNAKRANEGRVKVAAVSKMAASSELNEENGGVVTRLECNASVRKQRKARRNVKKAVRFIAVTSA